MNTLDLKPSFAVTVTRNDQGWTVTEFKENFQSLSNSVKAVRKLRSEGPAFALLCRDNEYFVIVRPTPSRVRLLLSDSTIGVEDDFAEEVIEEMGAEVPDLDPDELDQVDPWPEGGFDILADLGLPEQILQIICDDEEDWANEQVLRIAEELGFDEELIEEVVVD